MMWTNAHNPPLLTPPFKVLQYKYLYLYWLLLRCDQTSEFLFIAPHWCARFHAIVVALFATVFHLVLQRGGQRKRWNCLWNNAFIEHSRMLCMYVCACDVCFLLFCWLRSSWWSAFLPKTFFLASLWPVVSQFVCLWNLFVPYPQKSTSVTSKCMWVCLSGTHSGGVVSWSQPILCMRSQDKSIYFGPNVIYKYKKLVP